MILIKLGGSVITDKSQIYSFEKEITERLVGEIRDSTDDQLVIVHGGGSFGHPGAEQYRLNTDAPMEYDKGTALVQRDMRELNQKVVDLFIDNNFWAVSIPGGLVTKYKGGELVEFRTDVFSDYLELGTLPITFGDVAVDEEHGVTICSGDDLMERLTPEAEKAVFITDVDGICKKGELVREFTEDMLPLRDEDAPSENDNIDVTGGMNQKVKRMLVMAKSCPTYVVNGREDGRVKDLLGGGETVYTEVKA